MPKHDAKAQRDDASREDDDGKGKPKKVLRACDACHHRRVRCNHNNPCDNCIRLNINCTWIKASKGKQASGRRIDLLRKGHNPAASELTPSPPNQRPPTEHPPITAPSPSGSRIILPPPGHAQPSARSPRHYAPPNLGPSAMSPPGQPASAASPSSTLPSSLYSRDAANRTSFGAGVHSRYDPVVHANSAAPAQQPSPSSHWSSPTSRSPANRYPSHGSYAQQEYPPTSHHAHSSNSLHNHPHPSYPQHSSSHAYPPHQQYQQVPPHYASASHPPPPQRHPSNASQGSNGPGASNHGFAPSESFSEGLGGSFSGLAPDVAAGLRLPDFGTSLADSYLNPQEGGERRRSVLLDMNAGAFLVDVSGNQINGATSGTNNFGNSYDSHGNGVNQARTFLDVLGQNSQMFGGNTSTPGSVTHSEAELASNEPHPLSDSVLIPSIAIFFERLQSIMPVFTRAWVFGKIDRGEHRTDPQLGAMLIALSAFALCQPVDSADPVDSSSRKRRVRRLLEESVKMRNSALLGNHPSLEAIMASFFIFGTLFGLGEENAAWFRLREAVTLGYLLRIHETSSYEHLDKDEQERRLRAYLLLAITERAYAIQSGSSITFRGNPRKATDSIRRKFDVYQLQDFPNLQSRLFDVVDEKFVDCWNRKCPGPGCDYLDAKRAVQLHRAIKESDEDEQKEKESFRREHPSGPSRRDNTYDGRRHHPYGGHSAKMEDSSAGGGHGSKSDWDKSKVQKADVEVTRQWLLNRLWMTCRSHSLLTADATEEPLRIDYAIDIARETLRVCNSLSLRSMEAHGIGLTRKLNDIAQTLVIVCRDYPAIAMSVPFEGDPIKTDPTLFGPYFGPSPPDASAHSGGGSQHHQSPQIDTSTDHPSATSSNVVPLDKAFSPSYAIEAILHKYLDIFKRFRGGDHPYLPELVEAVKELPKMAELSFDRFLREMGLF
ncbi:C6 transcription factor [Pseudozyma hubeiensis]|nr:C6 transcription factor [Pseudozyma hubeiensis]